MAWEAQLFARGEGCLEGSEGFRFAVADEVGRRWGIFAREAIEVAGFEGFGEEEGGVGLGGKSMVAQAKGGGGAEAAVAVEGEVALKTDGAVAEFRRAR